MSRGLSKLQRRIVAAIANATVNAYRSGDDAAVRYQTVFGACQDHWLAGVPAIPGEQRLAVAKAAFSRAVWSLIRRGLVDGIALAWCKISTAEFLRWQGGGPTNRREGVARESAFLKMLFLTEARWVVARTYLSGDERQPIGAPSRL